MAKIDVNYNELQKKSSKIYSLAHSDTGIAAIANDLQNQLDAISKAWVDKTHYEQLNALEKECSTLRQYLNTVEKFQIMLQTMADEYKAVSQKNTGIANKSV